MLVVVINYLAQRAKAAVMVEAAFVNLLRVEQGSQRRCHIAAGRAAIGLKIVDADLFTLVQVVSRLGKDRRHMAGGALGAAVENCLASCSRIGVKAALGSFG